MSDYISDFRKTMANAGLSHPGEIVDDGKIHRFNSGDEQGNTCWYVLYRPDPIPAGAFGCWRRNISEKWHDKKVASETSKEDYKSLQKKFADADAKRDTDERERHERKSKEINALISKLKPASKDHLYLQSKKVSSCGQLMDDGEGSLMMPLTDINGKVWTYQTIDAFGDKLFAPGGRIKGCMFIMGDMAEGPIIICEGYATGASIHEATGWPVVCAMNCGNLKPVAISVRGKYQDRTIVIAADDDRKTPGNPGLTKAKEAAETIRGIIAVPDLSMLDTGSDFNDLACHSGVQSIKSYLFDLLGVGMGSRISIKELLTFVPGEDAECVIGDRFLCRGGSCAIVAETSAGKSALSRQMAICWALGLDFFGIKPKKPLRSVIIQAENDIGDESEMFQGILTGLNLVDPENPEQNNQLVKVLEKNLIIIRDQTHIGANFSTYARKLVDMYQPDMVWVDPMLSFFGDDINDQKAMSNFLRAELNPISEQTGIIWMILHHTGKPAKDKRGTQSGMMARDFAYFGIGSSELSNWARAIIAVVSTSEDEFRFVIAKRGWRAGLRDEAGGPCSEIHLAHSGDRICWRRIPRPEQDEDKASKLMSSFAMKCDRPMSPKQIVQAAAQKLNRGERTCWGLWAKGEGELGKLFKQDYSTGTWTPIAKHSSDL